MESMRPGFFGGPLGITFPSVRRGGSSARRCCGELHRVLRPEGVLLMMSGVAPTEERGAKNRWEAEFHQISALFFLCCFLFVAFFL